MKTINKYYNYKPSYKKESIGKWILYFIIGFLLLWIIGQWLKDTPDVLQPYFKKNRKLALEKEPNVSRGETVSKKAAEKIFKKRFQKIRPDFLKNNVTGMNLEIDIFNEELKLGIEYSGRQHYEFVPFFHKNKEAFLNQKYRDEIKRMKCQTEGINLIEIPYTVPLEDIESFIRLEAKKMGYDI